MQLITNSGPLVFVDGRYLLIRNSAPKFPIAANSPREFRHSRPCILTATGCGVADSVKHPPAWP